MTGTAGATSTFIQYLLAMTDGITGRIFDLLRRAAIDAVTHKTKTVGLDQLQASALHMLAIINQRSSNPILAMVT